MYSIKTKLVAGITLLIVGLFSAAAFLLIREKQKELTQDINFQVRSFGELTAPNIIDDYRLYLAEKGFIYFNREINETFQRTQDIDKIQIFEYNGVILYDSSEERESQYEGPVRMIDNENIVAQVQANNPSILSQSGRVLYIKKDEEGNVQYVNENEKAIEPLGELERIHYVVYPVDDKYAVMYYVNYDNLDALLRTDTIRIVFLAIVGMIIGLLMAIFFSNRITKPLKKLTVSSGIIAKGDFQHRVSISTHDELEILGNAFNKMAADLDKSTKALVYKERVAKELELAQKIQKGNIPKEIPKLEGLDISAGLVPAEEIGGDVYDFLVKDDDNTLFYLGDVTGHGVPSGILGSIANAMFYSYAEETDLKKLMVHVNKVLKAKSPANMFLTLCLLNWNKGDKKLSYVNAGHEQIIHFNSKNQAVQLLKGGGIALGMFPDINKMIEEQLVPLEVGDCIVLYSDGIPEAWKNEKENYGMDRFKSTIQQYGGLETATAIRNAILQNVKDFTGDYKQMDDITIMVIKRTA
ncbi:SpoIIE family protein phosphatase [Candidatus Peregrinibacteria bacterium]|nr:SpoIIE family protein phosphatase [Candidatus Peregrinibacteria bacterium]